MSTATALAVLFSSAALTAVTAGPASAASATVATPGGVVADGTLKRVFVGDRSAGKILATDYNGAFLDSVSGISGVSDLALSEDGTTLYAAASGSHEIVALDAATLDVKARYAVATNTGPRYVAFTGGKVWFTYGDQWDGNLGSVDPTPEPTPDPTPDPTSEPTTDPTPDPTTEPTTDPTPDPTTEPTADPTTEPAAGLASAADPVTLGQFPLALGIWGPGLLDTDASSPGLLAVAQSGISTDSMAVLDVSTGEPRMVAYHQGDYTLNTGIGDIDLVPGTAQVLVNGTERDAYADGKFTRAGAYPTGHRADVAANGLIAQVYGDKLAVYRPNATKPLRTYTTSSTGTGDLAWAPDSSRIFALVGSGGRYTLKALTGPTLNVPTLTVNAPSKATRAKKLTVTGKLSATVALPTGVSLQVTRTDLDSPNGKALPSVKVKTDGTYSFTDTPPAGGTVTYRVAYAGDAGHTAVSASDKVDVSRNKATLTLSNNGKVYSYGKDVSFKAHLGSTYKNRTVEIWANPYGADKPNKLVRTGKVNSSGNFYGTVDMKRDTVVTAIFRGDSRTAPKTTKVTAYAKVKISTTVSRHYKTGKVGGSTTYYWFHKNSDAVLNTTMTYYKGRQMRFDLQVYSGGRWYSADSQYFSLPSNGKLSVLLPGPGESGIKARIRSAYINGSSGDNVNSTTYGSWKYLYFTR
ncbi:YncE family protein [Streptomyces sp. NPDC058001]|uniref:YncE family protein n=1 Tax=Streptomyces sp. NPDC058001 TaxID=3346300 RepID=UPI0036E96B7A